MKKILFVIIVLSVSFLHAADDFMPISEIKSGMIGTGLTVFENNKIESFQVEILEIIYNFSPQRNLILVKLLGERVSHTGVASGMSGSPIYINNKLIGALAYRIGSFMKDPIAGVTPIEEMLQIFDKEKVRDLEYGDVASKNQSSINDYLQSQNSQPINLLSLLENSFEKHLNNIQPIETPLIMTGLQPAVYQKINKIFNQANFSIIPGGKVHQSPTTENEQLQPGAAVAGVIISGDFDISAVGTVTYCNGNKILAFGHPFFNSGPVNIPLAKARVITTLSSLYASNKYAVATDIIGNIRQDRLSGIMGVIGERSPMIPVNVTVNSELTKQKKFNFNVVNDRSSYSIVPVFLWITLINTLESARLANGDYALKLNGRIELENSVDVIFNNFYSGGTAGFFSGSGLDISEAAYDVAMTISALLVNKFQPPKIKRLELDFHAAPGQKSAQIKKIYFDKKIVTPGDTLNIIIHLKPYHGKVLELKKQIVIPKNISSKIITLAIGGNTEITKWEQQAGRAKFIPSDFDELIKILNRRRKNNDIILQLKTSDLGAILHGREFPNLPPSVYHVLNQNKIENTYKFINEKIIKECIITTDYGISGGRKFKLNIKNGTEF